jgi:hypothetical protein
MNNKIIIIKKPILITMNQTKKNKIKNKKDKKNKEPAFCFINSLYGFFCLYFVDFSPYFNYFSPACFGVHLFLFF